MPSRVAGASDFFGLAGSSFAGAGLAGCAGSAAGAWGAGACGFSGGAVDCWAASRQAAARVTINDGIRYVLRIAWLLNKRHGERAWEPHRTKSDTLIDEGAVQRVASGVAEFKFTG